MAELYTIDPQKPLAPLIDRVEEATLIPVDEVSHPGRVLLGGVRRPDGSYVENSACYIDEKRCPTRQPSTELMKDAERRSGAWLYGGRYDVRFGHFLVESLARLWALDHITVPIKGVVFLPGYQGHVNKPNKIIAKMRPLYDLFKDLPEPEIIAKPTQFETLFVPPQGCGAGKLGAGCPEFREFSQSRFLTDATATGGEKLYLSRTQLYKTPGQVVAEEVIEDAFAKDGFEIFHPQQHSIEEQIAKLRAAHVVAGVEGSAFHLVAYAARPDSKILIIRRRPSYCGIVDHCRAFHGERVIDVNAVVGGFLAEGSRHRIGNGVLDFALLGSQLLETQLLGPSFDLPKLSDEQMSEYKDQLELKIQGKI